LRILGRGSADASALATIDSTSKVALRTLSGRSGASPHPRLGVHIGLARGIWLKVRFLAKVFRQFGSLALPSE